MSIANDLGRTVQKAVVEEQARRIRRLRARGVARGVLADAFELSPARISQIAPASALNRPGAHQPDCAGQRSE